MLQDDNTQSHTQQTTTHSSSSECLTYLDSQSDGVEQDEDEHDVLEACGVDDGPELVLNRILWDVEFERLSLQSILHTLTLQHIHTHTQLTHTDAGRLRAEADRFFPG